MADYCAVSEEQFNPARLLDLLRNQLGLSTDAELAYQLDVAPSFISKIRHRRIAVSAPLLVRMHDLSGLRIRALCAIMGDRRKRLRSKKGSLATTTRIVEHSNVCNATHMFAEPIASAVKTLQPRAIPAALGETIDRFSASLHRKIKKQLNYLQHKGLPVRI